MQGLCWSPVNNNSTGPCRRGTREANESGLVWCLGFWPPFWGPKLPICCAGLAGRVWQSDGRAAEPVCSNRCLLASAFDWIGRQGVGDFQIWFLVACAGVGGCSIDSPCVSQTHAESLCGCVQTEASKSYYAWDLRSLGKKSTLWSFCAVCLDATLSGRCHLWSSIFHHHHSHDHHHHHHDSFYFYAPFTFTAWSTMIFSWKGLWWSIVCSMKNCCSECGLHVVCVRRAAICAAVGCALELEVPEMLLDAWA